MKKALFAIALILGLVAASSYNVRIEIRQNAAYACQTSDC